ncbi:amino acid ABC transporter substrate-binding protein [Rivibacter subsaxonicus]|uniref:Amino acid ABC transporter substrate-binding protein (PAAT family) n=1 Tax=Rivibacter subsaxonicus TaxID=457575 RepID=A0A4Q7VYX5_9BURK|nr:amino acid ABC transporter substrate-binding protein [Rivibacter subsaxonicus]RZU02002.1 amino acid ABC transporter substrate-binding protein (PAAT family) [Rivibacter subsaxonicus]
MKSRSTMPLALALAAAVLAGCASTTGAPPKDTLARISQTQTLTLGYREDSRPFSFKGTDGAPAGYSVELCKRVASSLQAQLKLPKLDLKWVPVTVATRMQAVNDGSVDLECGTTTRTLGREEQVDFSNTTWVDGSSFVSAAATPLRKVPDLNGKRVGVIAGTTTEAALKALAGRGVVPVFVPVTTHTDGVAAVRDGRADAYATDRLILVGEVLGSPAGALLLLSDDYLSVETYSLMLRRDPAFRLAVNRGLAQLYRSGEIGATFRQVFGPRVTPAPLLEAAYILNALPD